MGYETGLSAAVTFLGLEENPINVTEEDYLSDHPRYAAWVIAQRATVHDLSRLAYPVK